MGNLVVMTSGFESEGPGSIPDAAEDPLSASGVRARKISGSGRLQFQWVLSLKKISIPFRDILKV